MKVIISHATRAQLLHEELDKILSAQTSQAERLRIFTDYERRVMELADEIEPPEMADLFLVAVGMHYLSPTVMGELIELQH